MAAHADDIEFMMGGTLALLAERGWETHYMALANGYVGSTVHRVEEIVQERAKESRAGARRLNATWHPSLVNDCEIIYSVDLVRRVSTVIRELRPSIVLTQAPDDYMDDHIETSRIVASAAFNRNMPNFQSTPPVPAYMDDIVVYHAQPHGLYDLLRRLVYPGIYVDTTSVQGRKRDALTCHHSQQRWLQDTQGFSGAMSDGMDAVAHTVGRMSGRYEFSEGWRRHNHLAFADKDADPLTDALTDVAFVDEAFERGLLAHPHTGEELSR
ncbi:MAG: PIG-L deacetylase family protein [Propionibacteriaceae bacterium]